MYVKLNVYISISICIGIDMCVRSLTEVLNFNTFEVYMLHNYKRHHKKV